MEKLDTESVFFEALQHPLFAIPEFFLKKQQESGWSKSTFLTSLRDVYAKYLGEWNDLKSNAANGHSRYNNFYVGRELAEITDNRITGAYTLTRDYSTVLNSELLETLNYCIQKARNLNNPSPTFSNIQIISFAEKALEFILFELELQCGKKKPAPFSRSYPDNFTSFNENKEPNYLLHDYSLTLPSPVFDFYLFQDSLRSLLLESNKPENLKLITKQLFDLGKKIVETWNKDVWPLEETSTPERIFKNRRYIRFDTNERKFYTYLDDLAKFRQERHKHFYNHDLVVYAAQVGGLVGGEVLDIDNKIEVKDNKPTVASYAIAHVYWSRYDETKAITKTNKQIWAKEYEISENTLITEFEFYANRDNREKLPENKKEQKNSVKPFIKRFEDAAELLENCCPEAYRDAITELAILKEQYKSYLD